MLGHAEALGFRMAEEGTMRTLFAEPSPPFPRAALPSGSAAAFVPPPARPFA